MVMSKVACWGGGGGGRGTSMENSLENQKGLN